MVRFSLGATEVGGCGAEVRVTGGGHGQEPGEWMASVLDEVSHVEAAGVTRNDGRSNRKEYCERRAKAFSK